MLPPNRYFVLTQIKGIAQILAKSSQSLAVAGRLKCYAGFGNYLLHTCDVEANSIDEMTRQEPHLFSKEQVSLKFLILVLKTRKFQVLMSRNLCGRQLKHHSYFVTSETSDQVTVPLLQREVHVDLATTREQLDNLPYGPLPKT